MENKTAENNAIFNEKIDFSDTGSAILVNYEGNSSQNDDLEAISSENCSDSSKIEENNLNQPVLQEKTADLFDEASKSAFLKDYPEVDLEKLKNRQDFQSFLAILTQNPTLSQIYACYNSICAAAEKNSQKKLLNALANAKSSVGALSSAQEKDIAFFTKEQVKQMSPSQIKENYNKIRESQQRW